MTLVLTPVDWAIVAVLGISILISFWRGFVREAMSLGTWIASIVIARLFAAQTATLLVPYIDVPSLRLGAAYAMLMVGTLIVGALVSNLAGAFVKMTGLAGTDRFLGMVFGLARGGVIITIIVAGLYYLTPAPEDGWWQESVIIPQVVEAIEYLGPLLWEQGSEVVNSVTQGTT